MRFERLEFQGSDDPVTLVLHPRMTVIAGVGPAERNAVVGELVGALDGSRSAVQLDVVEDSGRRLAIHRPSDGCDTVVDVATSTDVSREFRTAHDGVDVLAAHGIGHAAARRVLLADGTELSSVSRSRDIVARLAAVDQTQLWATATWLRSCTDEAAPAASTTGPVEVPAGRRLSGAATLFQTALFGVVMALAATLIVVLDPAANAPALAVALLGLALVLLYEAGVLPPSRARPPLADAPEGDAEPAGEVFAHAEGFELWSQRWAELAGDISVDWALEHYKEIVATAVSGATSRDAVADPDVIVDPSAATVELAAGLVSRSTTSRHAGMRGEAFPLILDEPFTGLPGEAKVALLELAARTSGDPQIIVLTDDDQVASWGRREAVTGNVAVVEPGAAAPPTAHM